MNFPIQVSAQTEYLLNQKNNLSKHQGNSQLLYQKNKWERTKRKDQAWRRLATVNKIAQKAGYNLPTYYEKRTIFELLKKYGEYSYLTGKRLGTYYLSTLDIDIEKEGFSEKMIERLEKNIKKLLDCLQVSYDKTKKGLHVDILTPEPLDNQQIYYQGWGKKWNVGSIQSLGKYVVGEDKNKTFIQVRKWYWKVKSNEEIKTWLTKFFFKLGNQEKATEKSQLLEKEPKQQPFYLTKRKNIQAQILSKKLTSLEHIWKVFYLNQKTKQKDYFLVNDYHREWTLANLDIGSVKNMVLVQGIKHNFLTRISPKTTLYNTTHKITQ